MTEAERLNTVLQRHAPAAARCLSPLGRAAAFPKGIPWQSAAARGTRLNATIGQVTDGAGSPMPLAPLADALPGLDPKMAFLYSPMEGQKELRKAWKARQRRKSGGSEVETTVPMVTHGLTQGLSMVAELFADADTDVVVPGPYWGNYNLVFGLRPQARMVPWTAFEGDGLDIDAFVGALEEIRRKAVIILNFPQNPTGYMPTPDEVRQLVDAVTAHPGPAVILCDDAYAGMVYEDGLAERSLFWDLAERADPDRHLVVKLDGCTKELLFFPGRVGFVSHTGVGEAEAALASKLKALGRSAVSTPVGPSQAVVLQALRDDRLESAYAEVIEVLAGRYRALRDALADEPHAAIQPYPFNAGCFALVDIRGVDADVVRARLIREYSTGLVAIGNALRIAYCSAAAEDLPEIVDNIRKAVDDVS